MEILGTEKVSKVQLEAESIKGDAIVRDGKITAVVIYFDGATISINEIETRALAKELTALVNFSDKEKGVGSV